MSPRARTSQWDQIDQIEFLAAGAELSWLNGTRTLDEFSRLLALANLFPVGPIRESARYYRRWAFESAALDLAVRQNGVSFQRAVGRRARPVNFVASVRIGVPPNLMVCPTRGSRIHLAPDEHGPGRGQLRYLASLFHPDAPNDIAPPEYNLPNAVAGRPRAPLAPEPHPTGFRWGSYDGRRTIREAVARPPV